MIKAGSHNAAEAKAQKLYPNVHPAEVQVTYTEVSDEVYKSLT